MSGRWDPQQRLSRLWGELSTTGFTGSLTLEQDGRRHLVWWRDGVVVDAESPLPEDTLGRVALDAGLIDSATFAESVRRMAATNRPQAEVLVQMGVLTADMRAKVERAAFTRRSLRAWALTRPIVSVQQQEHRRADGDPLEPRWVLYRGVRQHFDEIRLDGEMQWTIDHALKLLVDPAQVPSGFGWKDEEHVVLTYLQKGYWEVIDVLEACVSLPRQIVLATLLALDAYRLVDVQPAGAVPRLRKRAREATAQGHVITPARGIPTHPPRVDTPPRGTATSSVRPVTAPSNPLPPPASARPSGTSPPRSTTVPPRPASTVQSRTTSQSLPAQPRTISTTLPPLRPGRSVPPPVGTPATGVAHTLRDQIMAKFQQIERNTDHFQLLELPRDANSTQVKAAYFSLAKTYHPDRLALVKLEDLRPQVERIFSRLSDAFAALGDEKRRKEYLDILAQGGERAVRIKNDEEVAKATKILSAEEHFRKGEMALRRAQWSQAIDEFKKALDMNPDEAEHHAYLAWAMWSFASDKDAAVGETKKALNKAIEINPRCGPAYYFLGQVYKHAGDFGRALQSFQRSASMQSGNVDAEREIRLLQMRRTKEADKGGLFDRFRKK
jgi:curved DNA-binding protein CbpA